MESRKEEEKDSFNQFVDDFFETEQKRARFKKGTLK